MLKEWRPAFLMFVFFTLLTGAAYPAAVTFLACVCFPEQAHGSVVYRDGKAVGSALIGQPFDDPKYFWGRLSATSPAYSAGASSGSNYGPLHPGLKEAAAARIKALKDADPANRRPVPVDLVTASASGLDPHISLAAAHYQESRVSIARRMPLEVVVDVIDRSVERRWCGLVGEPVVNVLKMNLLLDRWEKDPKCLDEPVSRKGDWQNPRGLNP